PKRVVEDNNLNQAIAALRRTLGEQHIATVAGRGYQFVTPVQRAEVGPVGSVVAPMPSAEAPAGVDGAGADSAPRRRSRRLPLVATLAAGALAAVALGVTPRGPPPGSLVGANVS